MEFTSPIDEYIVLKLSLSDYRPTTRLLDDQYRICGFETRDHVRKQERRLLTRFFENWSGPYEGTLKGWRKDSPTYVLHNNRLVAGVYLCSENEFNEGESWGQVHYAFIHPSHKGKGVYSVLFREVVEKAKTWNLKGLILNSDRYLLPDVYLRWGATPWKKIKKKPRPRGYPLPKRIIRRIFPG